MSHLPPSKKRYYYSSGPNHIIRNGGSFPKKGYQNSGYGGLAGGNVTTPSYPTVPTSAISSSEPSRPSRYDPNSPSRPLSSRSVGSRYNPETDAEAMAAVVKQTAPDETKLKPASSRYSGSRYKPQSQPLQTSANHSIPVSTSDTHNGASGQTRPRPTELAKKDPSYHYSSTGSMHPTASNPNSAAGYYTRNNKWRSHSGSSTKLDYDNYGSSTTRPSFWKSQKSKFPNVSNPSAVVKRTTPPPSSQPVARFNRYNPVTPTTTTAATVATAGGVTPHNRESSEDSGASSERSIPETKNSNPLSLGSSLINSVTQTTRRVEQQHATDHKRIHPQKPVSAPIPVAKPLPQPEQPDLTADAKHEPIQQKIEDDKVEKKVLGNETSNKSFVEDVRTTKHQNVSSKAKSESMWSSFDSLDRLAREDEIMEQDEAQHHEEEKPIFHKTTSRTYANYEFIYDPKLLKTNIKRLPQQSPVTNYSIPLKPIEACIFPLSKAETRLWELKNQPRERIVLKQNHLLKTPIKSISCYPFIQQNRLIHQQAIRPLLCGKISSLKRYEYLRKLQLRKQFINFQSAWEETCHRMDDMSREMRKEEIERKKQAEIELQEREKREREILEEQTRVSGSSRRRNRADFVDDAEIENVLLQIDPDYKHHQSAAEIPPMIIDPVAKYSMKFKNVNNLVTDKDAWASRILKDGIDTFTENEHELFVEGYLTYPKKFGKISQFMGSLRSPEDCVLHYYRTKSSVDYKKLLTDKNKKRQKGAVAKRRKKKEKNSDTDNETSFVAVEPENAANTTDNMEESVLPTTACNVEEKGKPSKEMHQVEITLAEDDIKSIGSQQGLEKPEQLELEKPTQDDSVDMRSQETSRSEIQPQEQNAETLRAEKRPYEAADTHSDAERTIVEDQSSTFQTNLTGNCDAIHEDANKIDEGNFESYHADSANEENLQRKRQKSNGDHKSSYWSVKEANLFPDLLKEHGSQWSLISDRLGTKSTTMVRNYYQRNAAQLGWKSIVEEADFRRNVTSSGSVQQSQMLIQAEQNNAAMANGIPPQQRPALGFFSNQVSSEKKLHNEIATPPLPYLQDTVKDTFSQASTPTSTLPPPRLPSIHLPGAGTVGNVKSEPLGSHSTTSLTAPMDNLLSKREKSIGTASSIMKILNSDDQKKAFPLTANNPTSRVPKLNALQQSQPTSAVRPIVSNVVVQELQKSTSSSPGNGRSSSISLLLNPDNELPAQPLTSSANQPSESTGVSTFRPPMPRAPQAKNFNFAMDPLGALAAIASESLSPSSDSKSTGGHDNQV